MHGSYNTAMHGSYHMNNMIWNMGRFIFRNYSRNKMVVRNKGWTGCNSKNRDQIELDSRDLRGHTHSYRWLYRDPIKVHSFYVGKV